MFEYKFSFLTPRKHNIFPIFVHKIHNNGSFPVVHSSYFYRKYEIVFGFFTYFLYYVSLL